MLGLIPKTLHIWLPL